MNNNKDRKEGSRCDRQRERQKTDGLEGTVEDSYSVCIMSTVL